MMIDDAPSRAAAGHASGGHAGSGAHTGRSAAPASRPGDRSNGAADDVVTRRVAHLESLLAEKDQIVTALTVQLEEAAERLDRVQRSGADRGPRVLGGLPREFLEQQQQLAEDVQRALEQWGDFQAAASLGRIEIQIGELRDLVATRLVAGAAPAFSTGDVFEPATAASPPAAVASEEPSAWQALKASILQAESTPEPAPPSESPHDDGGELDAAPPEAIDLDQAAREALCAAIEQRDGYIAALIRRVRSVELRAARNLAPPDGPEALQIRLAELEQAFQEQQRMMEIELSLERARVGREEARVHQLEAQLQKDSKRLGMHGANSRPATADDAHEPGKSRWKRMLGIGADE